MENLPISQLREKARKIRKQTLKMIYQAGSGHPGGSLSSIDILVALFFGGAVRYNITDHYDPRRDRFILSCGHVCPAYYAVLAECGLIDKELLLSLRQLGSPLQGHPSHLHLPLMETSTGSLGQGLSVAVGLALAGQRREENHYIFVVTSDGEHDEGSTWEAAMAASHFRLGHLINIIDRNGMQIGGKTKETMALESLEEKYESFGWETVVVNGHDYNELLQAICHAKDTRHRPTAIIAKTTRGKGVSFMENKKKYHACTLSKREYERAIKEVEVL